MAKNIYSPSTAKNIYGPTKAKYIYGPSMAENTLMLIIRINGKTKRGDKKTLLILRSSAHALKNP